MKTIYHAAQSRGYQDHGWLKAHHTFSFANYFDPERIHFGRLRVLNDDEIGGGEGFGMHPHEDMEIITIPLEGALHHRDSMGNSGVIRRGEVQVMSAGTGIYHSEVNALRDEQTKLLQIWVFPRVKGVTPRYEQMDIAEAAVPGELQQIVSPHPEDAGLWVHQDAWFSLGSFPEDKTLEYQLHGADQGVYLFVLSGSVRVAGQELAARDGLGVWETDSLTLELAAGTELLLMEVPMH